MLIFISHAAANSNIAEALAECLAAADSTIDTFVASRPGDIRADENWIQEIEGTLREADAYIVLLTPESVLRPWVNFEFGAAWLSDKPFVCARIASLSFDEIPLPIHARQIYSLEDAEDLTAIIESLGLSLPNADHWVARFTTDAAQDVLTGGTEGAWEGIELEGQFYAWAGSLLNLEDRACVPAPPGLLDEIRRRGLVPRWAVSERIGDHVERGAAQVFATNRVVWRRPVEDRLGVLMVGNPRDE